MRGRRRPLPADPDRRRALLLALLAHAALFLALLVWIDLDRDPQEPEETFLVIDLGEPPPAEQEMDAAAAEAPAPEAQRPEVAADAQGAPQEGTPDEQTEAPPPPAPAPEAPTAEQVPAPEARPPETAEAPSTPNVPPAPVPEIDIQELEPRPLDDALPVPQPAMQAELPEARDVSPQVEARVDEAVPVATPEVEVEVAEAVTVPAPQASASVPAAQPVPTPQASAGAGEARSVEPSPQAQVAAAHDVPVPTVRAQVAEPEPAEVDQAGIDANPPESERPPGGDAPRGGQPDALPEADADARGLAGSPDGDDEGPAGDESPAEPPLQEVRRRPLAVLVDNVRGYPQSGLVEARTIVEMPVEGGSTRLMPLFDQQDPPRVGPVRSARDYFVRLARDLDSILVHDGGSPAALAELDGGGLPTLNAFQRGELFLRAEEAQAPYNLYSQGQALRDAVNALPVDAQRTLEGYRPSVLDEEAPEATELTVAWSGAYASGFRYQAALDRYRWLRDGAEAVDADGRPVRVDAVLVARVEAREIPDDPEGRLFVSLGGGPATLYWGGRVHEGSWSAEEGDLAFESDGGEQVALGMLKTWAAFVPPWATTSAE